MPSRELSSRERLMLTIEYKETDYIPCCFMMFHGLRDRFPGDQARFVEEQLALGLDAVVELPELPIAVQRKAGKVYFDDERQVAKCNKQS